jgi:hypothetical protein
LTSDRPAKVPEPDLASLEHKPISGNVLSQSELRAPLVNYCATGASLNVEVQDNISILNLHGNLTQAAERSLVQPGQPPLDTVSQAIAHPHYTALYDADGKIIPESSIYTMPANAPQSVKSKFRKSLEIRTFEPESIDISEHETCNDTVVFGGAPHPHFGHHLVDGMSRLWYHSDYPTLYLNALAKAWGEPSFISEYSRLGRPRQAFDLQKPTRFANIVLPHAGIQNGFLIYGEADSEHLAITEAALGQAHQRVPSKVYLSRRGIDDRKCHGEEELEQQLASHGFAVLGPEALPIVDQIAIFNSADWIVGATGSAFHNLLFTRRGGTTKTVQITVKKPDLRYLMIDRIKGHTSYYARTMQFEEVIGEKLVSTRVGVAETMEVLRAIGAV